jgi:hypothetical protein
MFIEDYAKIELLEDGYVWASTPKSDNDKIILKKGGQFRLERRATTLCYKVKTWAEGKFAPQYNYYVLEWARFKYRYV